MIVSDAVLVVVAALIYDNAVLGLGSFIGEGPTLAAGNALLTTIEFQDRHPGAHPPTR